MHMDGSRRVRSGPAAGRLPAAQPAMGADAAAAPTHAAITIAIAAAASAATAATAASLHLRLRQLRGASQQVHPLQRRPDQLPAARRAILGERQARAVRVQAALGPQLGVQARRSDHALPTTPAAAAASASLAPAVAASSAGKPALAAAANNTTFTARQAAIARAPRAIAHAART